MKLIRVARKTSPMIHQRNPGIAVIVTESGEVGACLSELCKGVF